MSRHCFCFRVQVARECSVDLYGHARQRLHAHYLPSYAPELNPDEWVWGYLKKTLLPNFCPESLDKLVDRTRRALPKLQRLPTLLASFIAAAKMDIEIS